jgi:hypothetical protein
LEEGSIKAGYIYTKDQLTDLRTKPLGRIRFLELCSKTGMVQISHKTMHKRRMMGISFCTWFLWGGFSQHLRLLLEQLGQQHLDCF